MQNLKPIPNNFIKKVSKKNIFKRLKNKDIILLQNFEKNIRTRNLTPREVNFSSFFSVDPIYYIKFLQQTSPSRIYDIGCGGNIWKNIFPNIIGIDPTSEHADINDSFDKNFIKKYQGNFESVIAINALHFIPIFNFKKRMLELKDILEVNGRAYVTFNLAVLVKNTQNIEDVLKTTSKDEKDLVRSADPYIRNCLQELKNSGFNFLCIDIDFDKYEYNSNMDGNIRLVFEKEY